VIPTARATLCYGARSAKYLATVEDFQRVGVDVRLATDDGTRGRRGQVTELFDQLLGEVGPDTHVLCCGPEAMMKEVARMTRERGISCQVSLETPMACGIGICFSCVAKVRDGRGAWDYKRTCVEGPVFDARELVW
jgi:dihydroorotate dehydrogenase electron transfer subunit